MNITHQPSLFSTQETTRPANWFSLLLDAFSVTEEPGWPDKFGEELKRWNLANDAVSARVLSLFSGAGGLDIGFHDAGFDVVECNEIEEKFAATLIENSRKEGMLAGTKVICTDIKNYYPKIGKIDFVIGGPPCQTFSAAGARASGVQALDDERGNLFREYVRLLKVLKPKGFLFENVYRIVGAQGGRPWKLIQEAFRDAGYQLSWRILDAADYGVPQFRERLIIVGVQNDEYLFPFPSHGPDSKDSKNHYAAGHAIRGLNPKLTKLQIGGRHGHLLNDIPPGLNYSFYTERMGHPTPIFGWRSKFSDYLYKADPEMPIRTLKAQGGQYSGPFHWNSRVFTIDEMKRLQTFPDKYRLVGSRQSVIHQLGNSVPPQLSRILAMSVKMQLFDSTLPVEMDFMKPDHPLNFRARKSALTKIYSEKAEQALGAAKCKDTTPPEDCQGIRYGHISKNLRFTVSNEPQQSFYKIEYSIENNLWRIVLGKPDDTIRYAIRIKPSDKRMGNPPFQNVEMVSHCYNSESSLVLWKFFEHLIQKQMFKDDLVQLFGYYQYKQPYTFKADLFDAPVSDRNYWVALKKVTEGICVGENVPVVQLSQEYEMDQEALIMALKKLKATGYEIRSSNTNPQISEDFILIPYSFPTLTHRSLQRLKEL